MVSCFGLSNSISARRGRSAVGAASCADSIWGGMDAGSREGFGGVGQAIGVSRSHAHGLGEARAADVRVLTAGAMKSVVLEMISKS